MPIYTSLNYADYFFQKPLKSRTKLLARLLIFMSEFLFVID